MAGRCCAARGLGDFGGLGGGAVIAPEVVVVQRRHVGGDGNDAGAGGIEGDGFDLVAVNAGRLDGLARGGFEGQQVVGVGLRGELWVFALAVQRVLGEGGGDEAALAIDERDAHAQGAEIDSSDYCHGSPKRSLLF